MRASWSAFAAALSLACAHVSPPEPDPPQGGDDATAYRHNLGDYEVFRARQPSVIDPNYLPFMTYRVDLASGIQGGAERLVLCHWRPQDFPLTVHIEMPEIDPELQTLPERRPRDYLAAVQRALSIWQRDLDGLVSFREVPPEEEAALTIRLIGEEAPHPVEGVKVLGVAKTAGSCEVLGGDPATGLLDVRFRVPELLLYVADEHGLLLPDQVEKVALHELGHALGMRGHSPIPSDLMFEVAQDRISRDGLGEADINSFHALYKLSSGSVYANPLPNRRLEVLPPTGEPILELAPHVDPRLGFEVQTPDGWTRVSTRYGLVAIDGVAWEYRASWQLNVHRYDKVEDYLKRFGRGHLGASLVVEDGEVAVGDRVARRVILHTPRDTREELTLLETGDGRVIVVIGEAEAGLYPDYRLWFAAVLESLEVHESGHRSPVRDYAE